MLTLIGPTTVPVEGTVEGPQEPVDGLPGPPEYTGPVDAPVNYDEIPEKTQCFNRR